MSVTMPDTRIVPLGALGSTEPVEVLYEAEQPIVYTILSATGDHLLAYVTDETQVGRYVVLAPCGRPSLAALRRGDLSVREALTASWMWLALMKPGVGWVDVRAIEPSDLPPGYLPAPGTLLLPQHLDAAIARAAIQQSINPCAVCGRPRPRTKGPVPTTAITHCDECHVAFALDEIQSMFHEANMQDSNAARALRRVLVDDLVTALRVRGVHS